MGEVNVFNAPDVEEEAADDDAAAAISGSDDADRPSLSYSKVESKEEFEMVNRNAAYQIRPSLSDKFKSLSVREIIRNVLHDELGGKVYKMESSELWIKNIVMTVKDAVKELEFKRYKIIVQTVLGENKGSGVKVGARCLWDADTDNYASDFFLNDSMFCCVVVFGIYCY